MALTVSVLQGTMGTNVKLKVMNVLLVLVRMQYAVM